MNDSFVVPLDRYHQSNINHIGRLAEDLGKLYQNHLHVAESFCVTNAATQLFFRDEKLNQVIEEYTRELTILHRPKIITASEKIIESILKSDIPDEVALEIVKLYNTYGQNKYVQLRISEVKHEIPASVLYQDSDEAVRVSGDANLLENLKREWARLYSPQAISYRLQQNLSINHTHLAVLVELVPEVHRSGILTTIDPMTQDKNVLTIESVVGLPDELLAGVVDSDLYQIRKSDGQIILESQANNTYIIEGQPPYKRVKSKKTHPVDDDLIHTLGLVAKKVIQTLFFPQFIVWSYNTKHQEVVIHAVEQLEERTQTQSDKHLELDETHKIAIAVGGKAVGKVRLVLNSEDLLEIEDGEIIITQQLNDSLINYFPKIGGIVAEHGSLISHPTLAAKKLEIPTLVGLRNSTQKYETGQLVTLDASNGRLILGKDKNISQKEKKTKLHSIAIISNNLDLSENTSRGLLLLEDCLSEIKTEKVTTDSIISDSTFDEIKAYLLKISETSTVYYQLGGKNKNDLSEMYHSSNFKKELALINDVSLENQAFEVCLPKILHPNQIAEFYRYLFLYEYSELSKKNFFYTLGSLYGLTEDYLAKEVKGFILDLHALEKSFYGIETTSDFVLYPWNKDSLQAQIISFIESHKEFSIMIKSDHRQLNYDELESFIEVGINGVIINSTDLLYYQNTLEG